MPLLPHQELALNSITKALERYSGYLLCFDAGTGKTLPALLAAETYTQGGITLWVTLASLKLQAAQEAVKFNVKLKPVVLLGNKQQRAAILQNIQPNTLLIINYEQLLTNHKELALLPINFIVADECTRLGNQKNKTYKILYKLAAYKRAKRLALTGTPITRSVLQTYPLFDFLQPGCLGNWFNFATKYFAPSPWSMTGFVRKELLPELGERLSPYYLRRTREELLPNLPELIETTIPITLSAKERNLYNQVKLSLLFDIDKLDLSKVERVSQLQGGLPNFTRLRQICDSLELVGDNVHSSKMEALVEFLETLGDNKAIVFSEFSEMCELIHKALPDSLLITGSTPTEKRNEIVQEFHNNPDRKVLVGSRAIEMGLNITCANFVIHYDLPFNYSSLDQRISRARRQGQKQTVNSVQLVCENTIEQKIQKLIANKKDISLLALPAFKQLFE